MIKRSLAFLMALVLLAVSISAAAAEGAEADAEVIKGPVAKTIDDLNAMLDGGEPVTGMIDTPFYENVTDEATAFEAMESAMDRLGCDDTTKLVPVGVHLNVIMAIVPGIDYPMMAKLLPWCMKQTGCEAWLPVLEAAIQETRIAETEPGDIPDGCFMIRCEVPESLRERSDMLIMTFLDPNWKVVESIWPDVRLQSFAHVLQAGDYQIKLDAPGEDEAGSVTWLMAGDNWVCLSEDTPLPDDILFTYQAGRVYTLPTEGLE